MWIVGWSCCLPLHIYDWPNSSTFLWSKFQISLKISKPEILWILIARKLHWDQTSYLNKGANVKFTDNSLTFLKKIHFPFTKLPDNSLILKKKKKKKKKVICLTFPQSVLTPPCGSFCFISHRKSDSNRTQSRDWWRRTLKLPITTIVVCFVICLWF